jgi:hypothetical protein
MVIRLRSLLRPILISSVCAALISIRGSAVPNHVSPGVVGIGSVAESDRGYYPVVRLRKMHLVRPDLIPYPIYYAIYC